MTKLSRVSDFYIYRPQHLSHLFTLQVKNTVTQAEQGTCTTPLAASSLISPTVLASAQKVQVRNTTTADNNHKKEEAGLKEREALESGLQVMKIDCRSSNMSLLHWSIVDLLGLHV